MAKKIREVGSIISDTPPDCALKVFARTGEFDGKLPGVLEGSPGIDDKGEEVAVLLCEGAKVPALRRITHILDKPCKDCAFLG